MLDKLTLGVDRAKSYPFLCASDKTGLTWLMKVILLTLMLPALQRINWQKCRHVKKEETCDGENSKVAVKRFEGLVQTMSGLDKKGSITGQVHRMSWPGWLNQHILGGKRNSAIRLHSVQLLSLIAELNFSGIFRRLDCRVIFQSDCGWRLYVNLNLFNKVSPF